MPLETEQDSGVSDSDETQPTAQSSESSASPASPPESDSASEHTKNQADEEAALTQAELCFPTGWLAVSVSDIPAGTPVHILELPDIDVCAHVKGDDASTSVQVEYLTQFLQPGEGKALVEYEGSACEVDTEALLVNLPDIMPQAEYDIVYAYAATSKCGEWDIPDVTGLPIPGYHVGTQFSAYWNDERYVVPCAYATALKTIDACNALAENDLRLVVYDAYRPMTAQYFISDAFLSACEQNPAMAEEVSWGMGWYVASGSSGHNYGTDLDVRVCGADGSAIEMPSEFDAFSESGHLTAWPLASYDITPEAYCDAVRDNDACMALHAAFSQAGFGELASEWWHFSDEETEYALRGLVGDAGLDFVATLA